MRFFPHVTVATVVERDGRFLLVYEKADEGEVYNQPAGHLEENESLVDAAIRETLEETGWHVEPTGLLGVSVYQAPANGETYVRVSFAAKAIEPKPDARLDAPIIRTEWISSKDLRAGTLPLRSPLVLKDVERYLSGTWYELDLLTHIPLK